jgi:hypothetical protein
MNQNRSNSRQSGLGTPSHSHNNSQRQQHSSNQNNRRPNTQRHHRPDRNSNQNRNNQPERLSIEMIQTRLIELQIQHLKARQRYFEAFNYGDRQAPQFKKQFESTMEEYLRFERSLGSWERDVMKRRFHEFRPDTIFSSNHPEDLQAPSANTSSTPVNGPYITETQLKRPSYKDDTEESTGNASDYEKYKDSVKK